MILFTAAPTPLVTPTVLPAYRPAGTGLEDLWLGLTCLGIAALFAIGMIAWKIIRDMRIDNAEFADPPKAPAQVEAEHLAETVRLKSARHRREPGQTTQPIVRQAVIKARIHGKRNLGAEPRRRPAERAMAPW